MSYKVTGMKLAEGYRLPWYMGVAYYSPCSDHFICYPVPINLLVRWSRNAWWALKAGKHDALSKAYQDGRKVGRAEFRAEEARHNQRVADVIRMVKNAS